MIKADKTYTIEYIDASSISTFARCPARFFFKRVLGLSQPGAKRIAPDYGTAIHRALPHCYNGTNGVATAMHEFRCAWSAMDYGDDDEKRNTERAEHVLADFAMRHHHNYCP